MKKRTYYLLFALVFTLISVFIPLFSACKANTSDVVTETQSESFSEETPVSETPVEESSEEEQGMTSPIIYPIPEGEEKSGDYFVTLHTDKDLSEKVVECYTAKVAVGREELKSVITENMSFCYFDYDFSSPVYLSIQPKEDKTTAKILPEIAGVESSYENGTLTVVLTKPVKLSIEFDGDIYHNLFVFANEFDKDAPEKGSFRGRYFGPGVHNAGEIRITKGQTIYIAGGAVVYGNIVADNADDIRILGHGILDGSKIPHKIGSERKKEIVLTGCDDISIDGIIIRDAASWTVMLDRCNNAELTDIKQICYNFNSDGFDIVSCDGVLIDGAFVRNYDDNISLKAGNDSDCVNVTMQNCVLWADCAHNMLIGPESKTANYQNKFANITFKNIDVLESNEESDFYRGVMSMTCSDSAIFDNIRWEDIRIERMTNGRFLNFRYSSDYGEKLGEAIKNIVIKNVSAKDFPKTKCFIYGTKDKPIESITIENFIVGDVKITHDYFEKNTKHVTSFTIDGEEKTY